MQPTLFPLSWPRETFAKVPLCFAPYSRESESISGSSLLPAEAERVWGRERGISSFHSHAQKRVEWEGKLQLLGVYTSQIGENKKRSWCDLLEEPREREPWAFLILSVNKREKERETEREFLLHSPHPPAAIIFQPQHYSCNHRVRELSREERNFSFSCCMNWPSSWGKFET